MVKCSQKGCTCTAVAHITWPGSNPASTCYRCGLELSKLAQSLGFRLPVEPIEVPRIAALTLA